MYMYVPVCTEYMYIRVFVHFSAAVVERDLIHQANQSLHLSFSIYSCTQKEEGELHYLT